jgi:aprataxin
MGDKCERMNPLHRQSYSHAAAATAVGASVAAAATAVGASVAVAAAATAAAPTSVPVAAAVQLPVAIPVAQRKSTVAAAPGWRGDLQRIALHAEKSDVVLFFNEHVAVIPDKFPKASTHLLVIARDISLNKPSELTRDHLPLLLEMQRVAQLQVKQRMPGRRVQIGVHAVPSMMAFHVHVMTCDFVSDSLKNKKHWNSFTTAFFVPLETLIRVLERDGAFHVDEHASEELLRGEMACPRCGAVLPTIPAVKKHTPCE